MNWYLGVHISMKGEKLSISQIVYIDQIILEFNLENCRTFTMPVSPNSYDELDQHRDDDPIEGEKY